MRPQVRYTDRFVRALSVREYILCYLGTMSCINGK